MITGGRARGPALRTDHPRGDAGPGMPGTADTRASPSARFYSRGRAYRNLLARLVRKGASSPTPNAQAGQVSGGQLNVTLANHATTSKPLENGRRRVARSLAVLCKGRGVT